MHQPVPTPEPSLRDCILWVCRQQARVEFQIAQCRTSPLPNTAPYEMLVKRYDEFVAVSDRILNILMELEREQREPSATSPPAGL